VVRALRASARRTPRRVGAGARLAALPRRPTTLDGAVRHRTGPLGPTPYFAAIFAFVNIHHYVMDHVIWRRDNPETRYLSRMEQFVVMSIGRPLRPSSRRPRDSAPWPPPRKQGGGT